mmetsp:Transcript_2536/g.3672  ORF Transcript_2536/g.3672 Transcript_2536/m.3672 type:complete len:171 (+) Transcript_2536:39-551(+)|eukprot:CAMPEP_0117428962 /NCGR_PEP_ID=MMETSP0758-20121206/8555_1 /TAXON_ID=63605 /ORGANISM="Percolomonas cosmopolitus, Strain AE-1 (ATCC 50343)" /LENGTH=170 /DNA_ID=CAMNT_0005215613 /DNA_START=42 /DNA_END=554 /DNA_ORIENTATION=-
MVKHYSYKPDESVKVARARGDSVRVHFKNTCETCNAISKKSLKDAKIFLNDVLHKKQAVPFKKFNGGPSRHRQARGSGTDQCRWPTKSVYTVLKLLKNAEESAKAKGMTLDKLYIAHIQVNRAPKMRRRTFRAHGRINAWMSSPSHIQIVLQERQEETAAAPTKEVATSE